MKNSFYDSENYSFYFWGEWNINLFDLFFGQIKSLDYWVTFLGWIMNKENRDQKMGQINCIEDRDQKRVE